MSDRGPDGVAPHQPATGLHPAGSSQSRSLDHANHTPSPHGSPTANGSPNGPHKGSPNGSPNGTSGSPTPSPGAALGPTLEPHLVAATEGRLSPIRWFRSDWQRGGGSTGFASLLTPTGKVDVVVKLPVGYTEWKWTTRLGNPDTCPPPPPPCGCPTPKVFAHGIELNGYDLGWLILEKLPGMPIAGRLDESSIRELFGAAADFHQRAQAIEPPGAAPGSPDWEALIRKSRETLLHHSIAFEQRWRHALKDVAKILDRMVTRWHARPINTWCHGDLHAGNAMRRRVDAGGSPGSATTAAGNASGRAAGPLGPCVLIDLALVHAGHWIEDALYFERTYWGHDALLKGVDPVAALAAERKARRLDTSGEWKHLADVRRVLMAACAPAMIEREGNAKYVQGALERVEGLLGRVG